jgi:hypothetical protein
MSPITHLFASWLIAAKATDNLRDRRLVALSGLAPDLDGLGIVADFTRHALRGGDDYFFYQKYHHTLLHGIFGAVLIAVVLGCFAERRWRVMLWCFVAAHLHFICDLVGSRGPGVEDNWPIHYLMPFTRDWTWHWSHQWPLDAWPNRIITLVLLAACFHYALRLGDSFVGVFSRRADQIFVTVLRGWRERWRNRRRVS